MQQTTLLVLLVAVAGLGAVRGRPSADASQQQQQQQHEEEVGEQDEVSARTAMLEATRGLNQTKADVVQSTPQDTHVSNTSTGGDPTHQSQQRSHRESQDNGHSDRSKEIRINEIKNRVLGYLERFGRRNSSVSGLGPQMSGRPLLPDPYAPAAPEVFAEKLQSFYPSCELPRNTDEGLWSDGRSLNLLFEMSYPSPAEGSVAMIIAAKLRLYKLAQGNVTQVQEACPTTETTQSHQPDNSVQAEQADQVDQVEEEDATTTELPQPGSEATVPPPGPPPADQLAATDGVEGGGGEDAQVRVSVYWYTRSLKRHRVKRKLLDSKMFSVFGDEWAEFNIRPAVRAWRDVRKNFGLVVEVEDEDGQLLEAAKYFSTMNCSNEASATVRPIPGFLVETARVLLLENAAALHAEEGPDAASSMALNPIYLDAFLFPMIDMCTVELAKPTAVYERAHYVLGVQRASSIEEMEDIATEHNEQDSVEDVPYAFTYSSGRSDHPHRHLHQQQHHHHHHHHHPHHHHQHEVQSDGGGDWAHDFRSLIINKTVIMQAAQIKQALNVQEDKDRLL